MVYLIAMKRPLSIFFCILIAVMNIHTQTAPELAAIWENHHITKTLPSNVRHRDLKNYLEQLKKLGIKIDQAGFSNQNREIYQMEWGAGRTKVFLWSQMHGDEPTATSALIDMFSFLQKNRDKDWVKRMHDTLTIRAVPMLNPDGADAYQRRNAQGIDINRDALDLQTPEARLLKRLRDEWSPEIGFNLHNQQALTTAGRSDKQAAISLLVVYGDAAKTTSFGQERNKRITSAMVIALENFMRGYIGRYDDEFTPTAFGDNFSAWGTPTILIETGQLWGKDEMFLVKMNFVAILTALNALADGSEKNFTGVNYESLPENTSGRIFNFIFRNATVIDRRTPELPSAADIAINFERRRAELSAPTYIRQVGSLSAYHGLEEYDAAGYYVAARFADIKPGQFGELLFYKKDRTIDWNALELEKLYPPDAIFSLGKWIKGAELFTKK
jgi:Zinc carboxypeptidase